MTQTCKKCNKNYKTLTNEGVCYHCHIFKYGSAPNIKQFGNNEVKKNE